MNDLKLSEIVTETQLKDRYWSQLHKLNNSIKRSTSQANPSPQNNNQYCISFLK